MHPEEGRGQVMPCHNTVVWDVQMSMVAIILLFDLYTGGQPVVPVESL